MRTRYFRDSKGRAAVKAVIYESGDHNIPRSAIDIDARKICSRLITQGHEAYIVGGAVRDLLLGRTPKDFDIATDAFPGRVRKLFRNSRIIGRRFRLVHIFFKDGKVHEVATFRAPESGDRNHVFGNLHEDVMRRDFSLNALYYNPEEETVIDFIGGVKDIRKKVLRSVLPIRTSFSEDPVRMLRAVKYAAITGMRISRPVASGIRKHAALLQEASVSRLSEELYKILKSRNSEIILRLMDRRRLLQPLLHNFAREFDRSRGGDALKEAFFLNMAKLDRSTLSGDVSRGVMIRHLSEDVLSAQGVFDVPGQKGPQFADVVRSLKELLKPLVQPNRDVEEAVRLMFAERGLKIPRKKPRYPERSADGEKNRRRRRRKKKTAPAENRPANTE